MIKWWNDSSIEVVEIEGRMIALDGWNGEKWLDCWEVEEVTGGEAFGVKVDGLKVAHIYDNDGDDFEIFGYELV